MRKIVLLTALIFLAISYSISQTLNPYKEFGYQPKSEYILSGKKYGIDNTDSTSDVSRIVIDVEHKCAYIYDKNYLLMGQIILNENEVLRFLSVDPLTKKYPELTPYQFASNQPIWAIDLDGLEAKIKITTEVTGYTTQRLTGIVPSVGTTLVVVPTFKAILTDAQNPNKVVATGSVTRDSWYSRGTSSPGKYELINRHFEPADAKKNLYTGERYSYPLGTDLKAYKLSQYGSTTLSAQAHTKDQETFLDGKTPIDEARTNYSQASNVYLHIGGFYQHTPDADKSLAASYGCFGFVASPQIYATVQQANDAIKNGTWDDKGTTNPQYQTFMNKVQEVRNRYDGTENDKVLIEVIKRTNVKEKSTKTF